VPFGEGVWNSLGFDAPLLLRGRNAMPLMFNTILRKAGLRLEDVRLIRHKDKRAAKGLSPYELWSKKLTRPQFELYQSVQSFKKRRILNAPYWAVFLGRRNGETLFVGLYEVEYRGLLPQDTPNPTQPGLIDKKGRRDLYRLTLHRKLRGRIAKLSIEWGPGYRVWAQYASGNHKRVTKSRQESKKSHRRPRSDESPLR